MTTGCFSTANTSNLVPEALKGTASETVIINANIYTVNENNANAQAMAINNGTIIYIGSMNSINDYIGANTQVIDMMGKFIMPSFVDSHMHPLSNAYASLFQAALFDLNSHNEYITEITSFANNHPKLVGIQGAGFERTLYDSVGPRKEWLDAIDSQRPIGIVSRDIHSMWVNSKVLELLNITASTPNPPGGVIVKDPITGEPTGLLQEESAMAPARNLFPFATKEEYKTSLLWIQKEFNKQGITTAHDAWTEFDPNFYNAYNELAQAGLLTVRFRGSWYIDPNENVNFQIDDGIQLAQSFTHPHFQVNSFKFLADNILEEETALLLEPYAHRPGFYGIKNWQDAALLNAFNRVNNAGYQIHTHVIGDGATKQTLDALEQLPTNTNRHSLAHLQLARPIDVTRMGNLGISAHMSQYWMVIDEGYDDFYLPYLGAQRANNTYPHKSLFDAGVNVTVASDFITSQPNLMLAIYNGMERKSIGGDLLPPVNERVSLVQMLKAATINGAYANFLEDEVGSLKVGKKADFVVLSQDLFNISSIEIPDVSIEMTFFEGTQVHISQALDVVFSNSFE